MITDTHTHLYLDDFKADRDALMKKAIGGGVSRFLLPNIDASSIEAMIRLEAQYPENCFAMMGLHPCSVEEDVEQQLSTVRQWLEKRKFIAVGEIGLDLYWEKKFFAEQKAAFIKQMEWALEFDYAVSVHCREAYDPLYEILSAMKERPRMVFHCFSGTATQAGQVLALGNMMLGIGGVVTFKNGGLDKVVQQVPLENLVLETDAPYLAPAPFRGKRNEPAYILEIAKKVAELKNLTIAEVAEVTGANVKKTFKI